MTLLLILLSAVLLELLCLGCSVEGYPKKNVSHPATNNSSRIMIRATIHCIVLPTSCHGIVSRVFGCHPSARNGSTRFLVPRGGCHPCAAVTLARGCTCLPSWPPLYYHYRHRGLNVEAERGRVGGIFLLSLCVTCSHVMFFPRGTLLCVVRRIFISLCCEILSF